MNQRELDQLPKKFLVCIKGYKVEIYRHRDGFWRDRWGTVYALAEDGLSLDDKTRCGVGVFSLPEGEGVCAPHDYAYSSPYYQLAHSRQEADEMLLRLNPGIVGRIFYRLSRWFGATFWENKETR